eukprot:TRINITY_DN1391_c0_g1_i2.p1 TRINITY_DN1391_c0_g1~~TRINITY_DN1391_c0_g1_i2.p1  ORF type:complete len:243 (-),score=54.71 TRINITY_DN1391_c0_g1_i2:12-740(-)
MIIMVVLMYRPLLKKLKLKEGQEDLPYWLPFVHTAMEQKLGVVVLKHSYVIGAAVGFDVTTHHSKLVITKNQVKKMRTKVKHIFSTRTLMHQRCVEDIELPETMGVGVVDFAIAVDDTVFGENIDVTLGMVYRALTIQRGYEWFIGTFTSEQRKELITKIHDTFEITKSVTYGSLPLNDTQGNPFLADIEGEFEIFKGTNADVLRGTRTTVPVSEEKVNNSDSSYEEIENPYNDEISLSLEE